MKLLLLAIGLAALGAPAVALASGPTMTMREVPLHVSPNGGRTLASVTPRFNMVGVHWQGSGSVAYRTREAGGSWTAWRTSADDDRVEAGWHLGNLDWVGSASAIRFRTEGRVTRLRAYYVWSPPEKLLARRLEIAGSPPIIPRAAWNANESIRRAAPEYADAVHFAVVHHTAGSNNYTAAQSAAIVRGIEIYHVEGNGWNDIGYNLLVDKYGQVFEGRYGGVDKPVIGAHAEGFNTGSVGVAVIGDYNSTRLPAAAKSALEQLLRRAPHVVGAQASDAALRTEANRLCGPDPVEVPEPPAMLDVAVCVGHAPGAPAPARSTNAIRDGPRALPVDADHVEARKRGGGRACSVQRHVACDQRRPLRESRRRSRERHDEHREERLHRSLPSAPG
jgi:hypothetical protein